MNQKQKLLSVAADRLEAALHAAGFWLHEAGEAAKGNTKVTALVTDITVAVTATAKMAKRLSANAATLRADAKPKAKTTRAKRKAKKAKRGPTVHISTVSVEKAS